MTGICQRCNGCGWDNPAQSIDKCPSCGGSGKDGRERLTMAHLRVQTARLNREGKTETSITYEEFCDLKLEMEFIHLFDWAAMTGIPEEFEINGIKVKVRR